MATECDPVFEAADVGFERQITYGPTRDTVAGVLWEADPAQFAARYPDSGIVESYGPDQWPDVTCIDWWVTVDSTTQRVRISVEGWNLPDLWIDLSGNGTQDGCELADVFARLLDVRSPRIE